jgi:hypothetical protein
VARRSAQDGNPIIAGAMKARPVRSNLKVEPRTLKSSEDYWH